MLLLKWNVFFCVYMFFIKFVCFLKWFFLLFVYYYNLSVCENQFLCFFVMVYIYVVFVCNSDNNEKFIKFKIISFIFEMIFIVNGKFIYFFCLKMQRNIFVVKMLGEVEFVERDD